MSLSQLWLSMNNAIIDAACISTQNGCVKKKLWTFLNRDRIVLERIERNRKIDFFFPHPYWCTGCYLEFLVSGLTRHWLSWPLMHFVPLELCSGAAAGWGVGHRPSCGSSFSSLAEQCEWTLLVRVSIYVCATLLSLASPSYSSLFPLLSPVC